MQRFEHKPRAPWRPRVEGLGEFNPSVRSSQNERRIDDHWLDEFESQPKVDGTPEHAALTKVDRVL